MTNWILNGKQTFPINLSATSMLQAFKCFKLGVPNVFSASNRKCLY